MPHHGESQTDKIVRLSSNNNRRVVVTPEDADRFVVHERDAISACVSDAQAKTFRKAITDEFLKMCDVIETWCAKNDTVVRAVLAKRGQLDFILIICSKGSTHDFSLDDAISDLESQLYDEFKSFPINAMPLPQGTGPEGLMAFIDCEESLTIYARTCES